MHNKSYARSTKGYRGPADDGISVEFPDLPGALTCGNTDEEALFMAKECLALHLYGMERDGDVIPQPTRAADVEKEPQQAVVLIDVWIDQMAEKAVKKTLTIPRWRNTTSTIRACCRTD